MITVAFSEGMAPLCVCLCHYPLDIIKVIHKIILSEKLLNEVEHL